MLYKYTELRKKYKKSKRIKELIDNNELYKIDKGIYCDNKSVNYLELITFKYPHAIFTLESAFYYHNLTDVIPEKNVLGVKRDSYKSKNKKIKFVSYSEKYFKLGQTTIIVDGVKINIYDKERMLIELIKNRNSLGFDYYKEIIENYRTLKQELDMEKITEYINIFPNTDYLYNIIMKEVF